MIQYSISIQSSEPGTKKTDQGYTTKAYAKAQLSEHVSLEQFAEHISSHGCAYDEGDVTAILTKSVRCLREMLLQGKKINLGKLGDFSVQLKSEGARKACDFTSDNIKEVNVTWTPGEAFLNLRDEATFELVGSRKQQAEARDDAKTQTTIQKGDLE